MKDARLDGEFRPFTRRGHNYLPVSALEIALGDFVSPSRRVNDCE
jgi:hypothetical protein